MHSLVLSSSGKNTHFTLICGKHLLVRQVHITMMVVAFVVAEIKDIFLLRRDNYIRNSLQNVISDPPMNSFSWVGIFLAENTRETEKNNLNIIFGIQIFF